MWLLLNIFRRFLTNKKRIPKFNGEGSTALWGVGGRKDQNNLGFIIWVYIISDFFDRGGSEACMAASFTAFFLC